MFNKAHTADLTAGPITVTMLQFAFPMILGNLLQQLYNIADTLIVGRFLGAAALAAVGAAYALLIFLNSVQLGLCMGSGILFSMEYGKRNFDKMRSGIFVSFVLIGLFTLGMNAGVLVWIDPVMRTLQVPDEVYALMYDYLWAVFWGLGFTFLYNYFACLLRSVGNSFVPLLFLVVSVLLNIGLDLLFICVCNWGVAGAAWATVISQGVSALAIVLYTWVYFPQLRIQKKDCRFRKKIITEIGTYSFLTCIQQSVMNFGILLVQGLVNSFGTAVMAAFAAAVKIDSFAYMPAQDFGNAFSTFVAQNYGAGQPERIRKGSHKALWITLLFCLFISAAVFVFAGPLMKIFVSAKETEIIRIGVEYLRIEGAFYIGIGCLFLFYGYFRAIGKPAFSLVLTIISLGTRVALAYSLSAIDVIGVRGIWWSVPAGWFLADLAGWLYYRRYKIKTKVIT